MELRIQHCTVYRYRAPVVQAQHMAHLIAQDGPGQRVQHSRVVVDPAPAWREDRVDAFGNLCTRFAIEAPHDCLTVNADSLVSTGPAGPLGPSPAWESLQTRLRYAVQARYDERVLWSFASPFVPRAAALADYARPCFTPGRPWLEACEALMQRIHSDFEYRTASTEVGTPVLQAFEHRVGVCQDFAHIMLGCLRSLGLPARYVSGYLLTQPPPGQARLIGADASHAWISVPSGDAATDPPGDPSGGRSGGQWVDFDPTNRRAGVGRPDEGYVTLAVGRDFGDVSPLRGVIQGGGNHVLEVAVTVAPAAETESPLSHNATAAAKD